MAGEAEQNVVQKKEKKVKEKVEKSGDELALTEINPPPEYLG